MDAVSGGLLGAAFVAFIQGGFNYLDKRKSAPENTESKLKEMQAQYNLESDAKMLDLWVERFKAIEDKQTLELNGIRKSFQDEKAMIIQKNTADIQQIRQEAHADKMAGDLLSASLNTEMRQMISERGNDKLAFQEKLNELEKKFAAKELEIEKEKN